MRKIELCSGFLLTVFSLYLKRTVELITIANIYIAPQNTQKSISGIAINIATTTPTKNKPDATKFKLFLFFQENMIIGNQVRNQIIQPINPNCPKSDRRNCEPRTFLYPVPNKNDE